MLRKKLITCSEVADITKGGMDQTNTCTGGQGGPRQTKFENLVSSTEANTGYHRHE